MILNILYLLIKCNSELWRSRMCPAQSYKVNSIILSLHIRKLRPKIIFLNLPNVTQLESRIIQFQIKNSFNYIKYIYHQVLLFEFFCHEYFAGCIYPCSKRNTVRGRSLPGAPRLFTFECVGERIQATSAAPPWSSAQNYKNAKCSLFYK